MDDQHQDQRASRSPHPSRSIPQLFTHKHGIEAVIDHLILGLTSGCISACISASCTALGTWNLSISSIILAAPPAPAASRRHRTVERWSFPGMRHRAQISTDPCGSRAASLIPAGSMSTVV